jgi:radical SAM protein with 4Fe4S-binding SPASM domain
MTIQASGDVSACFLDWNKKLLIGNVEKQTVKQVWNNLGLKFLQMDMLEGNKSKYSSCRNCGQLTHGMPDNIDKFKEELLLKIK